MNANDNQRTSLPENGEIHVVSGDYETPHRIVARFDRKHSRRVTSMGIRKLQEAGFGVCRDRHGCLCVCKAFPATYDAVSLQGRAFEIARLLRNCFNLRAPAFFYSLQ